MGKGGLKRGRDRGSVRGGKGEQERGGEYVLTTSRHSVKTPYYLKDSMNTSTRFLKGMNKLSVVVAHGSRNQLHETLDERRGAPESSGGDLELDQAIQYFAVQPLALYVRQPPPPRPAAYPAGAE